MSEAEGITEREERIARVLRPLGRAPMTQAQAERAGQLLGMHWTTVYRLRERFLRDPVTSSLAPSPRGRLKNPKRLADAVEAVVTEVVEQWFPQQRELAHPALDVFNEVRRRCRQLELKTPGRNTVARRIAAYRLAELTLLAASPDAQIAPGSFGASWPLQIVQIDHTPADVIIVDRVTRQPIGRPWLTLAIDLATRTVPAFFVGLERPSAATVALLISRIVQPKQAWLEHLGLQMDWPVFGVPQCLHLDNAAEFRSRALRMGCAQYGIELMYRPVGKPHYGGHIERLNGTLMQRLKGLPGATGNTTRGRKERKPEEKACLTLAEFECWLALEIGQKYHHSEHRGLFGGTPLAAWNSLVESRPPKRIAPGADEAQRVLINFMPLVSRSIQADGLILFYIRYWHPVFVVWREQGHRVRVRYHPEDLSRIYASADGRNYVEARYADLRRPSISLWEQRAAVRALRAGNEPRLSEELVFKAIGQQRQIVKRAKQQVRRVKGGKPPEMPWTSPERGTEPDGVVDYSKPVEPFAVEIW
ncbi:Mu transposase C-terminal domain-containing protein [Verminephrobacter eiseniae]|uniref:Mu transposase C-terminal domain-containing protein n=1 Tax=Verminephrobacter eiseniae TaxID=364317 RepID=UPI0022390CF9|nr:Mu transposase C-terminal domain-containing protein [Verminephrobacter eiseniae]MCW5232329.1 transposase [Verminephrobacter eiseniae]MCW5296107.1 transposase [Verminephrobacter eiseniae]MCW8186937.1 transposase [Verminephrobacter eiseniae]MCW8225323.1 transposase [Verminephrobacter eiseniae]MCW8236349.1 transposase [Verminephrobacter eiseniae]